MVIVQAGKISFSVLSSLTPLQPLVNAINSNGVIKICVVAFLDSSLGNPAFTVYQNNAIGDDGYATVQFIIQYNAKETQAQNFTAYQLSFSLNNSLLNIPVGSIDQMHAFLWDSDPIASRGTITNVQRV